MIIFLIEYDLDQIIYTPLEVVSQAGPVSALLKKFSPEKCQMTET